MCLGLAMGYIKTEKGNENKPFIKCYEEFNKLENYLKENGYEYTRRRRATEELEKAVPLDFGEQICVYENGKVVWDAIFGAGTYGAEVGLLEVMGEAVVKDGGENSVNGWLTAEDIIERLKEYESCSRKGSDKNAN